MQVKKQQLESDMEQWTVSKLGHLMRRTDSFEKTLMLGKIEGRGRRGQQIGSELGKEYVKAVYCHPTYLTYM